MEKIVFKLLLLKALPIISGVHIGYKNESLGISICSLIFPLSKKFEREKYNPMFFCTISHSVQRIAGTSDDGIGFPFIFAKKTWTFPIKLLYFNKKWKNKKNWK